MKNKFIFFTIIILCASVLYAKGNNDKNEPAVKTKPESTLSEKALPETIPSVFEMREIEVTGRIRLVGSGPINNLVLTAEDREWYIDQGDRQKLWQLQQQIVTVSGKEYWQDLTFANGMPAGRQYFLKDIRIINGK